MKYLIKDSTGKPSVTHTAFIIGFITATAKLLLSGIEVGGLTLEKFSGGEYASAVAALGAIYVLRRNMGNPNKEVKNGQEQETL